MHYGIGNENDVRMHYFEDVMICKLNRLAVIVDARRLGAQALRLAHGYKEYFLQGDRCKQCAERCLRSFTCPPLHNNEPPLPQRTRRNWTSTASDSTHVTDQVKKKRCVNPIDETTDVYAC